MNKKKQSKLWLYFALIVFAVIAVAFLVISILLIFLYNNNLVAFPIHNRRAPFFVLLIASLAIGATIALFVGKVIIKPIQQLSDAFQQLAKGDFDIRLEDRHKLREMRELSLNFNQMVHELSNIETLRNDFVVNVSHEFKTPLATIEGYATLLQDDRLESNQRERYLLKILDSSRQLSDLSGNILNLSKLENQERVPNKKEYRLDEQIRSAVLSLEDKWSKKQIDFDIEMPEILFFGNEGLLFQVWFNIIDNAIKHSHEGGIIRVVLETSSEFILVGITDHGCGMSNEVQRHLFEKFYQGDGARKAEGNGLGLAIVKRIIDLCDGNISIASEVGSGSTFSISLPNEEMDYRI